MAASPPSASKFQLLARPLAVPSKCAGCGNTDCEVVDTRLDIQFYGTIYFCITCLHEIARVVDMVPRSEVIEADKAVAQSFQQYLDKNEYTVVTNEWYVTICDSLDSLRNIAAGRVLHRDAEDDIGSGENDSEQLPAKSNGPVGTRSNSRQSNRPARVKGPNDVPADSGDELFNLK